MNFKKIILFLSLILFLVSVSAVSASDLADGALNAEDIDNDIEEIEQCTDDAVSVANTTQKEAVSSADSGDGKVGEGDDIYAQTMYFDANARADGDGSRNSPFKYVTDARLPYGVTAYFANGIYELDGNIDLFSNDGSSLFSDPSKVTFYGASTDGVIFKCTNASNVAFIVNDNSRFYAYNMTFDNAVVQNNGRFEAYGCVFKNGIAVDTTASYYPTRNNAFGGAIYSPGSHYATYGSGMKSYLTLENCLFMNNRAVYGGSIYHKYGNTIIRNTKFIDSYADLYGGVLATDGGDIQIENCEFVNCHAAGDAGGAIYSKVTNLTVKNSNFTNGYGDFGGAICNLNSDLNIENCNFYNNTAKLEGGAIYVMYGNVNINNCNITLSSAKDGGAIFEDNCTDITVKNTKFDKSSAARYGGTIFSNGRQVTFENVVLGESTAAIGPVVYHQDKYDYDIGYNADYELMRYQSAFTGILPSRYDLREEGYVTPVRDQQGGGNCWAFAGIAALETCIYKATGKSIDLSEENVKNLVELYSAYGWKYDTNEGGHSEMTWGHLISWLGPVLENDDIYDDYSTLSTLFDAVMHVQNVYYLPTRTSGLDNDAIKRAIMDYGGISVGIYWDDSPLNWDEKTASYYMATTTSGYPNHAVCIVGWDDNYDKDNFPMGDMAATNGAWIVKNSWGEEWGDNGYFYVSYYDPVVCAVGEKNDVYTFILNDTVKYNRNYQYDIGGMTDYLYPEATTVYYKNTFTAIGNDILTAFSTMFEQENDYEAKIYINDKLVHTQKGHSFGGYATIPLTKEFQLTSGDKFTIEIKVSAESEAGFPICEMVTATRLTYSEGISFFSTDGKTWYDLYSFTLDRPDFDDGHRYASQVACIKAFTRASGVTLGSSIEVNDVTGTAGQATKITAIVKDENGKLVNTGYVTFDINGNKETVKVVDGNAILETTFDKEGTFTVTATFDGGDVYEDAHATAKVTMSKATVKSTNLNAPDVSYKYGEDNTVIATLTDIDGNAVFNADVKLTIGDNSYVARTDKNGVARFNVNLAVGDYFAKFEFTGNNAFLKSTTTSTVKVTSAGTTQSDIVNVQYNYGTDGSITAIITDENGNAIQYTGVSLTIGGKSFNGNTDSNGMVKFIPDLPKGEYSATVTVAGKTVSPTSPTTVKVGYETESSTLSIEAENTTRAEGSAYDFKAKFLDQHGNVLAGKEVQFIINGNDYFVLTDEYGVAKISNRLIAGNYEITIINPATGEILTRNAKIVKRITGNRNINMDYTTSSTYNVRVYGDNGQVVGAGEKVIVKVGSKSYTAITNKNGYASVVIKGLTPNTYSVTAEYKGVKVSNSLVVKNVLTAKNTKFKKSKKVKKFKATLKINGKTIKGKKIKFKVNGKKYKAKTNKKGVATIKIKNLKKAGKYKVKISYLKSSIKKTITVKK